MSTNVIDERVFGYESGTPGEMVKITVRRTFDGGTNVSIEAEAATEARAEQMKTEAIDAWLSAMRGKDHS